MVVHEIVGVAEVDGEALFDVVVVSLEDESFIGYKIAFIFGGGDADGFGGVSVWFSGLREWIPPSPAPHASNTAQGEGVPDLAFSEVKSWMAPSLERSESETSRKIGLMVGVLLSSSSTVIAAQLNNTDAV